MDPALESGLQLASDIVGWIYFVAWSISFYPQIWINFRRKSVVGLNFDFVALNIIGFLCYSIFNVCLYFLPSYQEDFHQKYPDKSIPVILNDVFFGLHALTATLITGVQCLWYERGGQKVALWALAFIVAVAISILIMSILMATGSFNKLNFIYVVSYVKLTITIIKYVPQAWYNFARKSTVGWSIGNILLDITGGMFSLLQMFILAYISSDWVSIFTNPTKFGLSLFSILFDLLFILQHYVFYRDNRPTGERDLLSPPGVTAISYESSETNSNNINP